MQRWERAARSFLAAWPPRRHVTGALVCGSYVTQEMGGFEVDGWRFRSPSET